MKRGTYMAGAMFASLAAGPVFVASLALAAWAIEVPTTYSLNGTIDWIGSAVAGLVIVVLFGFFISAVPNAIGAWFMHGLGIGNFAAQFRIAWALVGAGAAGLPFAFVADLGKMGEPVAMAFALTGASCALVAHRFTTWDNGRC